MKGLFKVFEMGRAKYEKVYSDLAAKFDVSLGKCPKLEALDKYIGSGAIEGTYNSEKKTFEGVIKENILPKCIFYAAQIGSAVFAYKFFSKHSQITRVKKEMEVEDEISKTLIQDTSTCYSLTYKCNIIRHKAQVKGEDDCQSKLSQLRKGLQLKEDPIKNL